MVSKTEIGVLCVVEYGNAVGFVGCIPVAVRWTVRDGWNEQTNEDGQDRLCIRGTSSGGGDGLGPGACHLKRIFGHQHQLRPPAGRAALENIKYKTKLTPRRLRLILSIRITYPTPSTPTTTKSQPVRHRPSQAGEYGPIWP